MINWSTRSWVAALFLVLGTSSDAAATTQIRVSRKFMSVSSTHPLQLAPCTVVSLSAEPQRGSIGRPAAADYHRRAREEARR